MKCIYCTADIPEGSTTCDYCGKSQNGEVVTNQEVQNNMAQNNNQYYPAPKQEKNKLLLILLLISIIICGIACFLPYFSVLGVTHNYVYGEDRLYDGSLILGFEFIAIICLLFKKKIPVLIFQILSCGVFFYDYFHQKQSLYSDLISRMYGVGFYLLFIFLIISFVLSLIRLIKSDIFD